MYLPYIALYNEAVILIRKLIYKMYGYFKFGIFQ